MNIGLRLFFRNIDHNREVYLLKFLTATVACMATITVGLFSLHEFGYDQMDGRGNKAFRVLEKNLDPEYTGNRLSCKIPSIMIDQLKTEFADSFALTRVKIMKQVDVAFSGTAFGKVKVHAVDSNIHHVLPLEILQGDRGRFVSGKPTVMVSQRYLSLLGDPEVTGKHLQLHTHGDTLTVEVVAVFRVLPENTHEDFDFLLSFHNASVERLNFSAEDTGIYGWFGEAVDRPVVIHQEESGLQRQYFLQPIKDIYFGPRVSGEDARHGDRYSLVILLAIASLILLLAVGSMINLTIILLPHRAKELAVKKLVGTGYHILIGGFLIESFILISFSFAVGLLLLVSMNEMLKNLMGVDLTSMILRADAGLLLIVSLCFVLLPIPPVLLTWRFVRSTPTRLLGTDTITFPALKRTVSFLQLGLSIFLIVTSIVVRRQINYSLVKEPGENHDQILYLYSASGLTHEEINSWRARWHQSDGNIIDVMGVSQMPDRVSSKEISSKFYRLQVDPTFRSFLDLSMKSGNWFKANDGDSIMVINEYGSHIPGVNTGNVIGVVADVNRLYNQPEKPLKISLASDGRYHWLCIRVLEVDIRKTKERISDQFPMSEVRYFSERYASWITYQDQLNEVSDLLSTAAVVLSAFSIYGLSISMIREQRKPIAIRKLHGARMVHVIRLLIIELLKPMVVAVIFFFPIAYIVLNELLRTFVYSTGLRWQDPIYPVAYCLLVIAAVCCFQAISLGRTDMTAALKQ